MKILLLMNSSGGAYKVRKELIAELSQFVGSGEVFVSCPHDNCYSEQLEDLGCQFIRTEIERRGTNPFCDVKLFFQYMMMIKRIRPSVVLSFTIKPNVYGGIASRLLHVPYLPNITGLGTSIENPGLLQRISLFLYKLGLASAQCVFFQNDANRTFFYNRHIYSGRNVLLPGSGVNLIEHQYEQYPCESEPLVFLFVGRVMKDKGIEEYLQASQTIVRQFPETAFQIIGGYDENYSEKLEYYSSQNIITYLGYRNDVHDYMKKSHCIVLPSYHEGMANVLLEAAACGRPVLASNIPGCRETFDEGVSGFGFEPRSVDLLVQAIEKFIGLSYEQKAAMGLAGRKKVEKEFDRQIVVDAYMNEIHRILQEKEEGQKNG